MRSIEKQMLAAITSKKHLKTGNMEVMDIGMFSAVFLHGNRIAFVYNDGSVSVEIETLRKYPTRTTCSRLRALGVPVSLVKGVPHIAGAAV
jgi:hypothetical protein